MIAKISWNKISLLIILVITPNSFQPKKFLEFFICLILLKLKHLLWTSNKPWDINTIHLIKINCILEVAYINLFFRFCIVHFFCSNFNFKNTLLKITVAYIFYFCLNIGLSLKRAFWSKWQFFAEIILSENGINKSLKLEL